MAFSGEPPFCAAGSPPWEAAPPPSFAEQLQSIPASSKEREHDKTEFAFIFIHPSFFFTVGSIYFLPLFINLIRIDRESRAVGQRGLHPLAGDADPGRKGREPDRRVQAVSL